MTRISRLAPASALLALTAAACGGVPPTSEEARGVAPEGVNIVLVLTITFIVVAVGLLVGALAVDRFVRTRRALEARGSEPEEPEEEEEEETEVAGIAQGSGGVPRWLYAFYVIIPIWALGYVFLTAGLPSPEAEETPEPTGPTEVPTEITIVGENIEFDLPEVTLQANTDVTVTFDNEDSGIPHNFTVWDSEAQNEVLAETSTFNGVATESVTFSLPPGEYYFNCTVHPSMEGTLRAVEP